MEQDGRHDFDFLFGSWTVQHRRLKELLKGSTDWVEFEGTAVIRSVLNGLGNVEEAVAEREAGAIYGMATQIYNPQSHQWFLYWADSVYGATSDPMIGRFENGRGEFLAHESFNNSHVYSRSIWQSISPTECYWEQAMSPDGGRTWETNWTMNFYRTDNATQGAA